MVGDAHERRRRLVPAGASPSKPLAETPAWVRLVRAPNPGPMTLDGTNTWVLRVPGADESVVVDPGPLDEGHLASVAAVASAAAVTVITTHGHHDHTEGVERFLQLCPSATRRSGAAGWSTRSGIAVKIMRTPGHTADSITLLAELGTDQVALTGDTILGRGTTVLAHPDGDLGDYLESLRRLERLGPVPVLPGHGPALASCAAAAAFYLDHRMARLDQVRAARAAGAETAAEVVRSVYAGVDPTLRQAAEWSVRAQLAYLARESTESSEQLDPP